MRKYCQGSYPCGGTVLSNKGRAGKPADHDGERGRYSLSFAGATHEKVNPAYKRQAERLPCRHRQEGTGAHGKAHRADETGAQGITEQLKAENALEWVQRMNNIRACAREIVEREIIY